ncbi:hypothetical protein BHE74_00049805 [Ensete ventricosum]|nr:hypothetical protein BHE74_00049805 [Ensete ventricosum]
MEQSREGGSFALPRVDRDVSICAIWKIFGSNRSICFGEREREREREKEKEKESPKQNPKTTKEPFFRSVVMLRNSIEPIIRASISAGLGLNRIDSTRSIATAKKSSCFEPPLPINHCNEVRRLLVYLTRISLFCSLQVFSSTKAFSVVLSSSTCRLVFAFPFTYSSSTSAVGEVLVSFDSPMRKTRTMLQRRKRYLGPHMTLTLFGERKEEGETQWT